MSNNSYDRQTDRYFIDRKKVNSDLFVIEIRDICTYIYNIVNLLKSYDNIHSMTYITKIMLTGIAIKKIYHSRLDSFFNPLTAKLFNWNFHPLEVVSR